MYLSLICIISLLFVAPLLILSGDKTRVKIARLLFAIIVTYILINLTLYIHRKASWEAYQTCQSQFSDGMIQQHVECGKRNIADGASAVFYVLFGWIPATGYVGLWELVKRIKYRHKMKLTKDSKWKIWFSNIVILFVIPLLIHVALFLIIILYGTFYFHIKPLLLS